MLNVLTPMPPLPWMRYESRDGLGAPMRKNDHSCKALAYLLAGPYMVLAEHESVGNAQSVSYLQRGRTRTRIMELDDGIFG